MPSLETVWINTKTKDEMANRITKLADLKKTNWPSFGLISISGNKVLEGREFSKMNACIHEMWLDWSYDAEQIYDISWVFKLKTPKLTLFGNFSIT